jgi:hypothetical protein
MTLLWAWDLVRDFFMQNMLSPVTVSSPDPVTYTAPYKAGRTQIIKA